MQFARFFQLMSRNNKDLNRGPTMLNAENEKDKQRFEKIKEAQVERGRDEQTATQVAASEVKDMREREGRAKEPAAAHPPQGDPHKGPMPNRRV
jgi:hypothetical protein